MDTFEKKYNEALNWVRKLYPGLHGETKEDAEHYFPELRESEDERVRKGLIELDIDKIKREWYNKGYLEGRKNAHVPARELGLPKSCDFQEKQPEDEL